MIVSVEKEAPVVTLTQAGVPSNAAPPVVTFSQKEIPSTTTPPVISPSNSVSVVKLYNRLTTRQASHEEEDKEEEKVVVVSKEDVSVSPPASMISPDFWNVLKDLLVIEQHATGRVLDSWCPYDFEYINNQDPSDAAVKSDKPFGDWSDPHELFARRRAGFDAWCTAMNAQAKERLSIHEQQQTAYATAIIATAATTAIRKTARITTRLRVRKPSTFSPALSLCFFSIVRTLDISNSPLHKDDFVSS